MRKYPVQFYIFSDKKNFYCRPCVLGKNGAGIVNYDFAKPKYSCASAELGQTVFDGFDFIVNEYSVNEPENSTSIPWKRRGEVLVMKYENGEYRIIPEYVNHEIMTTESIEVRRYPSGITAGEMGEAVKSAMECAFDYALRQEIDVYYSDKEGLLFVPMAISRTGYVLADYCRFVPKPYSAEEVRRAVEDVFNYAKENPEDKRTNKERKENLPWREYSKYKSMHGFIKAHNSIEMHRLTDGSYVFIPKLRLCGYDTCYVNYENIETLRNAGITDSEMKEEIFAALERSRLMTEKHDETFRQPDHNELFFSYCNALKKDTNNKLDEFHVR